MATDGCTGSLLALSSLAPAPWHTGLTPPTRRTRRRRNKTRSKLHRFSILHDAPILSVRFKSIIPLLDLVFGEYSFSCARFFSQEKKAEPTPAATAVSTSSPAATTTNAASAVAAPPEAAPAATAVSAANPTAETSQPALISYVLSLRSLWDTPSPCIHTLLHT